MTLEALEAWAILVSFALSLWSFAVAVKAWWSKKQARRNAAGRELD